MGSYFGKVEEKPKDGPIPSVAPNVYLTESLIRDLAEVRARRETTPIPIVPVQSPVKKMF